MPLTASASHAGRRRALFFAGAACLLAGTFAVAGPPGGHADALHACPVGSHRLTADPDAAAAKADGDSHTDPGAGAAVGPCWKDGAPGVETALDLAQKSGAQTAASGLDSPGAMASAVKTSASLTSSGIANSGGSWARVGNGTLQSTNTDYYPSGYGLTKESGRLSGYALGPNGAIYAAAANGGVWKSADQGNAWSSIGDNLPNQTVGAVAWTSAGGSLGTVLALTGDNSFGRYNWSGTGLYYTTNEGTTWKHATGIPDGSLGFKIAVAPDSPTTVYAATGNGLFRSTNGGQSFVNVDLPTVNGCWDHPFTEACALSSVVTDVTVRGADTFGNAGGAVVAAVGWRAGNTINPDGTIQAPNNGLYESATGAPGSFSKLADGSGFPATANVGRVSLGSAYGPNQNHNYLYALVQDAQLYQQGGVKTANIPQDTLDQIGAGGLVTGKIGTYINGAYVSSDFGKTWTQMADTNSFIQPASGSALVPLEALGTGPGVQSWYNNWIQPDPYAADPLLGAPTRLDLGLEEIWETGTPGTPQVGPTAFHVVAPYTGLTYACPVAGTPCGTVAQNAGLTSTHPDQHSMIFLPPPATGLRSVLTTSDGGNYKADVPLAGSFKQTDFQAQQSGFNTLLPYGFGVSHDGTVVAGLQDNGTMIVHQSAGTADEMGPGDGGTAVIDPNDPNVMIYSATSGSTLDLNTTGGKGTSTLTETNVTPDVGVAYTYPQLRMDYAKPTRLIYGGRKVYVADAPMASITTSSWTQAIDLGTQQHPGDATATATPSDPNNIASAVDIYNGTGYVGFCGVCETLLSSGSFSTGIATNVGGTWHVAAASGLPHRLINTVLVDHNQPSTVYVGLGVSTQRSAFQPGLTGADGVDPSGGFLYKSTDGGQTFQDITGTLPRAGVQSLQQYGSQLIVGSVLGAFISSDLNGTSYGHLGTNLPAVDVNQIQFRPGYPNQVYISTYGRGIWSLTLTNPAK